MGGWQSQPASEAKAKGGFGDFFHDCLGGRTWPWRVGRVLGWYRHICDATTPGVALAIYIGKNFRV
jgi:hypothetical protein